MQKIIDVYKKDCKNPSKTYNLELVREYDISEIDILSIKKIIPHSLDDLELFDAYLLDKKQIAVINSLLTDTVIDMDEENYIYMFTQFK